MTDHDHPRPIVHALPLPAPLHNPKTACGIEMSEAGLAAAHAEGSEVLGVRNLDDRITCALCRAYLGARKHQAEYTWDPETVPSIQEMSVEHGVSLTFPVDMAQVIAAAFLDMMRTAGAENFLLWHWGVDFGLSEKFAQLRKDHPDTEWDDIELVTYVRKRSTPDPATLAAERRARICELEAERLATRASRFDALQALDTIAATMGWDLVGDYTQFHCRCTCGHDRLDEDAPLARWCMGEGGALKGCCVGCLPAELTRDRDRTEHGLFSEMGAAARKTLAREGAGLRARRHALRLHSLDVARDVAAHLAVHESRLDAARNGGSAFLEASLLALEDGTFQGDPVAALEATHAVLSELERRETLVDLGQRRREIATATAVYHVGDLVDVRGKETLAWHAGEVVSIHLDGRNLHGHVRLTDPADDEEMIIREFPAEAHLIRPRPPTGA